MERQKRWHFFLILGVMLLTLYNILPTVFYYSNPLKKAISPKESHKVAENIVKRVNSLEDFTINWLKAEAKQLGLRPTSLAIESQDPRLARVTFKSEKEATLFAAAMQRAGALIPFVPAQLSPLSPLLNSDKTSVLVQRHIGVHLDPQQIDSYFTYIPKVTREGSISPEYKSLIDERIAELSLGFAGTSDQAKFLGELPEGSLNTQQQETLIRYARSIVEYETIFGENSSIAQRYFAGFTQSAAANKAKFVDRLQSQLKSNSERIQKEITSIRDEEKSLQSQSKFLDSAQLQKREAFENQKGILDSAQLIVGRNKKIFSSGKAPFSRHTLVQELQKQKIPADKIQSINIGDLNPFVNGLLVNWSKETVEITLHPEVEALRTQGSSSEKAALQNEKLNQLLFNEIASVSRNAGEVISPSFSRFIVELNHITNSTGLLRFDLKSVAQTQVNTLKNLLASSWSPEGSEFVSTNYPVMSSDEFASLPADKQKFGLVVYAPSTEASPKEGFRSSSLYVIARGLEPIVQKYQDLPASDEKKAFEQDFQKLAQILRQNGFIAYRGSNSTLPTAFQNDYIFELDDYYSYLLAATREDFHVQGTKQYALLEYTDVEQRLLTQNKIDTAIHEDLVKWRDEYQTAQVSLDQHLKDVIPAPTQNVYLSNLKLSTVKYLRGDPRKILKWGLDLSGGKTVRIGLTDHNNHLITNEDDLRQAVNELYRRVNKLGVSEVGMRVEGSTIMLDFPGSQGLSASELIQASAMYFHVANEKFSLNNESLAEATNTFLEEVWNEAVITHRTDGPSINEIAFRHLGGDADHPEEFHPLTSHAQLLYDQGLRLVGSQEYAASSRFNDSLSMVTRFRGNDYTDWQGQTHPLLIVFKNYALEGTNLTDVMTGYDSSEGNILHFNVKGAYTTRTGERVNPRDDFYAWTSVFSEEKIAGTPREVYSHGKGWRMAVVLNGSVVNAPVLNAALRDSARITGHFSQREINQLAADLKAGALSFTPKILSEQNISPDLGKEQRIQGISSALIGLCFVILVMCIVYRFGGVVASIAVLLNLLILWAVLQNLGAALTLPGIAGIILTVGMAVDANVLVFERVREEFAKSGKLQSAMAAGYRKAFTAIIDSNLTTILAALILLNFDSGPVKGFALTLIIGILSSMFTSLFVTRYFFAGWVQNPQHKELKMVKLFKSTSFNFMKYTKPALISALLIMLVAAFATYKAKNSLLGMDFTGGYALTMELQEKPETNYRLATADALKKAGALSSEFQIRELNKPNQLRVQLSTNLEQPQRPFSALAALSAPVNPLYRYQSNPRIEWIVHALEKEGLFLNTATLPELDLHWTEISGQLSDAMRNNALIGMVLALIGILIYITIRFEFKYALSATIALAHDLLITIGFIAILHIFFRDVQVDLQVIAALLTIIGYSLNDTIIIFDRIREELPLQRKLSFYEVVNYSLNATLSRTVMTSGTTLAALLALVIFGGPTIFNFALVMTLGVAIGTFSSLFVAAPMLLFFHQKEQASKEHLPYKPH